MWVLGPRGAGPLADDALQVQVWAYDPLLLSDRQRIDPLSLYLSLRDERDERSRAACEALLKEVRW